MKTGKWTARNLRAIVAQIGVLGTWQAIPKADDAIRFRSEQGSILNYWPETGSFNVQGQNREEFLLAFLLTRAELADRRIEQLEECERRLRRRLKRRTA